MVSSPSTPNPALSSVSSPAVSPRAEPVSPTPVSPRTNGTSPGLNSYSAPALSPRNPTTPAPTATPAPAPLSPKNTSTPTPAAAPAAATAPATPTTPTTPAAAATKTVPPPLNIASPAVYSPYVGGTQSPHLLENANRLYETRELLLKQLKDLDNQHPEKKDKDKEREQKEKEEREQKEKEEKEQQEGAAPAEEGKPERPKKRQVGTIRKLNEQQYNDLLRAQLTAELEEIDRKLAELEGGGLSPKRMTIAVGTPATHGEPPQRRLTPPRSSFATSELPPGLAAQGTLRPVRQIAKREEELPEGLRAAQRINARGSAMLPAGTVLSENSPPPSPSSNSHATPISMSPRTSSPVAVSPRTGTSPPKQGTPPSRPSPLALDVPSADPALDDLLGYNRMTYTGINPDSRIIRIINCLLGIKKNIGQLDRTKLEAYLTEAEFKRVFQITREEYNALPKWKQERAKRDRQLL